MEKGSPDLEERTDRRGRRRDRGGSKRHGVRVLSHASRGSFGGTNGLIVYSVLRTNPVGVLKRDICVLDPTSGQTGRLTAKLFEDDGEAAWDPGGTRIAFTREVTGLPSSAVVQVLDLRTNRQRNVSGARRGSFEPLGSGYAPAWLPGGRELAYAWGKRIRATALGGRRATRTVWRARAPVRSLSWSPDGRRVAFVEITNYATDAGRTSVLTLAARRTGAVSRRMSSVALRMVRGLHRRAATSGFWIPRAE
jgi:Tol biopolymer transport system component